MAISNKQKKIFDFWDFKTLRSFRNLHTDHSYGFAKECADSDGGGSFILSCKVFNSTILRTLFRD